MNPFRNVLSKPSKSTIGLMPQVILFFRESTHLDLSTMSTGGQSVCVCCVLSACVSYCDHSTALSNAEQSKLSYLVVKCKKVKSAVGAFTALQPIGLLYS
jgi:hypothetical protein